MGESQYATGWISDAPNGRDERAVTLRRRPVDPYAALVT